MDHVFAIPVFGAAPFLERCIESIQKQLWGSPRIVLGTSTPSERLREIARNSGVPLLVNSERRGIAADWNFILKAAKKSFVTIAHQDDYYSPEYLGVMSEAARLHSDLVIAFSNYSEHTEAGERVANLNLRVKRLLCRRGFGAQGAIRSQAQKRRLLNLGNPICCPSVMINCSRAPDFEFSSEFKTNLDWDAWLRLADVDGAFVYSRRTLLSKRVHADSETTATIGNNIRQREDLQMLCRFWPKQVAATIAAFYSLGYLGNKV